MQPSDNDESAALFVDRLRSAVNLATHHGVRVRVEWLDGQSGGACQFGGQRWVFIDQALSPAEQLAQVCDALSAYGIHSTDRSV
jgi:hypothetical protein